MLDEELNDKAGAIEKYELEIKRRNDEIEKKTREIDLLNRRLERMVGNMEDEETGPLEATIKNLQREIDTKTELVGLQNENQALSVTVTRLRAEHTVLVQRRRRLETTYEGHTREVKSLNTGMARLHVELQRVNGLIASNASAREALAEDNLQLETRIAGDLHDMEIESARLQSQIEESRQSKRDVLSEMVEVERQVMLWERKLLLEKEMREVLDPTVGQDVVGEMKKEIHRMQLRHGELMRLQEKLIADMEKALSKRDLIGLKGRATVARAKQAAPPGASAKEVSSLTRGQLDKAVQDLQRSVRDTEQE
ncbi:flagellar-associated protein 172, partial [Haematococcus lacustris]